MFPRITVVDYVEVKVSCNRVPYRIRFKAGKLGDPDHPGVCAMILSEGVKLELRERGYFPDLDGYEVYRTLDSLVEADEDGIILDYEELPQGKGASGDCFCFQDNRGDWRCLCEN